MRMKKYDLILADPPWSYNNKVSNGAADNHYNTTGLYPLSRLPVEKYSSKNSVLFMWYTGNFALEAIKLAEAWGFKVRTMKAFTWVKFNPLAWQRIDKAIQNSELFDYHDLFELLDAETKMNGGKLH